jgi:hypothetical protein
LSKHCGIKHYGFVIYGKWADFVVYSSHTAGGIS